MTDTLKKEESNNIEDKKEKELELFYDKHLTYLTTLDKTRDKYSIGFFTNEHLKVSALFWGVGALNLINHIEKHDTEKTVKYLSNIFYFCGNYSNILPLFL